MDKSHEQAQETRRCNQEIRKAQAAAKAAEEKQDKAHVLDALRAILKDPEATAAQRIYAVAVLEKIQSYNLVPYNVPYPSGADSSVFQKDVYALQEQEETRDK